MDDALVHFLFLCRAIIIGNVVQERLPMVSQLMEGLKPCGILTALQTNPEELLPLFCIKHTEEKLDEYTFSNLFKVSFREEQQKKRPRKSIPTNFFETMLAWLLMEVSEPQVNAQSLMYHHVTSKSSTQLK